MAKKLPKKIFARWNDDDPNSQFLMADEEPTGISTENEAVSAGVYELTRKVNIVNETKITE